MYNKRSESSVSSLWDCATSISDGIFVVGGGGCCVGDPGLEELATWRGGGRVVRQRLMNGNGSVWLLLLSLQQYTAIDRALDKLLLKVHSFLL